MRNHQDLREKEVTSQTLIKLTRKEFKGEHESAENIARKCSDEHIYDSADQTSQNQMKMGQVISSVPLPSKRINWGTNKSENVYHTLESSESPQDINGEINPKCYDTLAAHLLTKPVQNHSADCSLTQYSCQFDDPTYESNIQLKANPQVTTTLSSMKVGLIEVQENGSTIQGNPDFVLNYNGDPENVTNAPQYSDPTVLPPMDNRITTDIQEKVDGNLSSIYDMFNDPTYGVCVTLDPTK